MQNLNELGIKKRVDLFSSSCASPGTVSAKMQTTNNRFDFFFICQVISLWILLILSADMCSNTSIILLITILWGSYIMHEKFFYKFTQ